METDREIARREPPAAGLAACLRRNADDVCSSHSKKMRSCEPHTSLCYKLWEVPFAGGCPNGSAHSVSAMLSELGATKCF